MPGARATYDAFARHFPRGGQLVHAAYRRVRPRRLTSMYDESYFSGRTSRVQGVSGYGDYGRQSSSADVAAYLLWRFLPFHRSLDVGCARGYLVEALAELGYDAGGADVSRFAVAEAAPGARGRLTVLDLTRRRSRARIRGRYDLVTALEVLEHLDPTQVPSALRFLRRIAAGWLVVTIPSIGHNPFGPDGFVTGKVRPVRLEHYHSLGPGYDGPVPYEDLIRDADGRPLEGHLCIASFRWWTAQFERAGFTRVGHVEERLHPVVGRFELSVAWNLYVFWAGDGPPPPLLERGEDELAALERRWGLDDRPHPAHAINITRDTVGEEAVSAIWDEVLAGQRRRERLAGPVQTNVVGYSVGFTENPTENG